MDKLDLHLLPQVAIDKPCPENWDAMVGDEQKRFCQGCGCHVHNLEALAPDVSEALLDSPVQTCIRMTTDPQRGVLTKSGWIPRLAIAGAMAASVSGCAKSFTPSHAMGSAVVLPPPKSNVKAKTQKTVEVASVQVSMGKPGRILP
jgi:hypothetical protein